jgi:hypothetical protein
MMIEGFKPLKILSELNERLDEMLCVMENNGNGITAASYTKNNCSSHSINQQFNVDNYSFMELFDLHVLHEGNQAIPVVKYTKCLLH